MNDQKNVKNIQTKDMNKINSAKNGQNENNQCDNNCKQIQQNNK